MRTLLGVVVILASGCIFDNPIFDLGATEGSGASASEATSATTLATSSTSGGGATTSAATSSASETTGAGTTTAGASASTSASGSTGGTTAVDPTTTGEPPCEPMTPAMLAGPEIIMAPGFAGLYTTYELGPVPGIPADDKLGGLAIHYMDDNTLLVGGAAETSEGQLYEIAVTRGPCGHILGFAGEAKLLTPASHVSDFFFLSSGLLFYSEWDENFLSQIPPGKPVTRTDLGPLGVAPSSGGIALVPPELAGAGGLRVLSYDTGKWYHLERAANGDLFQLGPASEIVTIDQDSAGVAYVPAGSPGFDAPSVLITQDDAAKVLVYEVDGQGDPTLGNVHELFSAFPFANSTHFDRVSGDLLISTIDAPIDKVFVVQGFAPPPPLQG